MLNFHARSARTDSGRTPYYKQSVDYGRLLMMGVSSVLLLGLIFTFSRPRHEAPAAGESAASDSGQTNARVTLVGGAILAAALCVVATAMFVLWRMAGRDPVQFAVHDVEAAPDFRSLDAQPPVPTPREALADITVDERAPTEGGWPS